MPQDEELIARMRAALEGHAGISEKRMMGGTCFFLNGHMLSGARRDKDGLGRFMFRVGKAQEAAALRNPAARPVIQGARKLGGLVHVTHDECDAKELQEWLQLCLTHAASLPPKS